ncbi:DUF7260 family protein [Halobellus ruber]|uniref:DUF7260 domain-containing protein n=1 Tax=Halobellus ruber TaxID=2761102 RepID=A0A7J9SLM1_9EURY|nr:hypothetical protein [Halobellus ruber]MBB6646999.1 hypothetical protein [Halobellus ruber]
MSQTTYIDAAAERVEAERAAADAKRAGMKSFLDRVADLSADSSPAGTSGVAGTGGLARRTETSGAGGCESVRTVFAETVHPKALAENVDASAEPDVSESASLTATIRRELTESIAVAVAPASNVPFSPGLKRGILTEARRRRAELDVLCRALDRESESLQAAADTVASVSSWIAAADETPLTELGFDALRRRHESLATHRDRCDDAVADRQSALASTTAVGADAGLRHRDLVGSIYEGLAVDFPVVVTLARLDDACRECQRSVRAHLVRRA